ncbi:hypothetical protein Tco_0852829 [Tanacetum coccineum]
MGDENPIRTLGDYSKPIHEGYRNTIELPAGNNVVPFRSDTILLVQTGCSFHGLRFEDPNQHLKDFLKLVDSLNLDGDNKERMRLLNKVTTSCEICSGPHDTQYCMEDPEQAFVEYASSRTDEAGDARLSKFKAHFKQQQSEMTNKIDIVLKAITDRIAGALPSDTVKNPKLSTSQVLLACSYPTIDPQCSTQIHNSINAITIHPKQQSDSCNDRTKKNEKEEEDNPENAHSDSSTPPDPSISFITKKVLKFNSIFESLGLVPPSPNVELVAPKRKMATIKGMHIFIGNFTYIVDFMIVEDISSIIDPTLSKVVLGRPFVEISNMTHDPPEGVVRFINETDEVSYKMPYKIEHYSSLSDLEKEHTKSVYLRNEEDKRRGVEYVMSKILGFYKECLELGLEYLTGMDDDGEVT